MPEVVDTELDGGFSGVPNGKRGFGGFASEFVNGWLNIEVAGAGDLGGCAG